MKAKTFNRFILESRDEERLRELGLSPDPLSITLAEFKKMLRKDYQDYIDSIRHEDDWMGIWDYYSENARGWEREYGIRRNEDTGELEYTWANKNYVEDDEDDEYYDDY